MSLTASVAIVFVMLLRLLLKKAPKVISYALWGVVLFRLLCPVSFESGLSLFGIFETPTVGATDRTSMVEYIPSNIVHTEYPEVVLPVPGIGDTITEALPKGEEQLRADPLEGPIFIATYVWWGGILVMAIYGIVTWLQLRRRLVTASPLRENIYLADDIDSPFVMGLIRPKIYLPSEMEQREQSYIILHEQHHIRRMDHIVKALAFAALCIHWFNPLVWVAFILSGKDMEMSCDEAVVRKLGTEIRADYTASLLSLATGKHIIAGMPLAFGEGNTKGRIKNLANWKRPAFWVGDGYPDICATYSYGSGIIDTRIVIHDYANGASYELSDRGYHDFYLRLDEDVGGLYVEKRVYPNGELVSSGRLVYKDGCILLDPSLDVGVSSLREKYPEYIGLDTSNGLDVYVWQMNQNSYSFGVLPHEDTPRDWISAELMNLRGTDAQEMRLILKSYGLEESDIHIIPWQNPYSSYIADIWIIGDDVSQEDKQMQYIEQIRNMLFPSEEVAAPVETTPTESPVDYGMYISRPEMSFPGLEADGIQIDENWIEVQRDGAILEYHMTYDSPAIILEFGLLRDDGLEIKTTVEDGVGIDSLENIPAGRYQLFVRNIGYVNDLPGKTVTGGAVNCTLYGGTTDDIPIDPDKIFVDLTQGEVNIKAEDIANYIFYTNSMKIVVTVKDGNTDSGIVNLHPSESTELFVGTHKLQGEKQCVFTGLTSARYYLMSTENLTECELTVSGEQSFLDKLFG